MSEVELKKRPPVRTLMLRNQIAALSARVVELEAALATARSDALREAAEWCASNTIDTPMDRKDRVYAGMFCAGEHTGGVHQGMGYSDAILALIPQQEKPHE